MASKVYTQVRCLLLSWDADDLGCVEEVESLKQCFESRFRYTVETWLIHSIFAQAGLALHLQTFVDKSQEANELLIIYCGGHAYLDGDRLYWAGHGGHGAPYLDWHALQNTVITPSSKEMLLILDCCYTASTVRSGSSSRKEILAATGWEFVATGGVQ